MSPATTPAGAKPIFTGTLLLAGAGKMGGALLDGWLSVGMEGRRITVTDPHAPEETLVGYRQHGVLVNPPASNVTPPDVLVLAIKPQNLASVGPALSALVGPDTLILSIVAGKTIADLATVFPTVKAFARAMPNTPAAVRCGVTGIAINAAASTAQKAGVDSLMRAVGTVEWLDHEALIDAVTAVSGSGPAYVFYMVECLAQAGEALGLPPGAALRLARATVEGAGSLLAAQADISPATLRANVTSPGGTTAAALAVLMADDRLQRVIADAVEAARDRAVALAG